MHLSPVIPSADVTRSLGFWVDCLGFEKVNEIHQERRLVWSMLKGHGQLVQINKRYGTEKPPENYEGIRFYWVPEDLEATRQKLSAAGFRVSDIVEREYGRTEFFTVDADSFNHCFGVETSQT